MATMCLQKLILGKSIQLQENQWSNILLIKIVMQHKTVYDQTLELNRGKLPWH